MYTYTLLQIALFFYWIVFTTADREGQVFSLGSSQNEVIIKKFLVAKISPDR